MARTGTLSSGWHLMLQGYRVSSAVSWGTRAAQARGSLCHPLIPRRPLATVLIGTFAVLAMIGCASTGSTQVGQSPSPSMTKAGSVTVTATSRVPNSEETTRELEAAVIEKLREKNAFESVRSSLSVGGRRSDLVLNATITEFQGVSDLARGIGGAFAGQSVIVAEIVVRDGKTGEVLGSATVRGTSSAGHAFAGTTIQAIQRTAEQIAGFVSEK